MQPLSSPLVLLRIVRTPLVRTVCFVGFSVFVFAALPNAHGLLTNGDFGNGLTGWKNVGSVTANEGAATLSEGTEAPVLYQAVTVDGYVYELRFNLKISGLSSAAGGGSVDVGQLLLYGGTEAGSLDGSSAAEVRVLVEVSSAGVTQVAANASAVPNVALGSGWYSAVVDFSSDFPAIAVAATILNNNELADSTLQVSDVELVEVDRGRLANISNRGPVGTGGNIMIPGFAIEGTTTKSLLIRGVGPTLGGFGVGGTIVDPAIELFPSSEFTPIQSNDNWEDASDLDALKAAFGLVGAFPLTEGNGDAAMLVMDLAKGGYTVQVSGVNDVTGVALAEVYDLGALLDGPTEVVNISNRGFVGVGAEVQIPGFVIGGARGKKVLIRAVGPSLAVFGVPDTLADPLLELYDQTASDTPLFTNDNWEEASNAAQIKATAAAVGAFVLLEGDEGKDAAILIALPPGQYSAKALGKDGSTGVALVEVYMVTENQRPVAINNSVYVDTASANVLANLEILGNDEDPDEDLLMIGLYSQPEIGSVALNDDGELVYTAPVGFLGEAVFSYRASDGEYESVPATIALQVTPANAVIWQGGSSGNFTDPANWIGGEAPGENDPVWIAPEGDTAITIDADTTVGSIRAGGTGAAVTLKMTAGKTLTAAGGLQIQPGSTLEMSSGRLVTAQPVKIDGALKWSGGIMAGESDTVIGADAIATITGDVRLAGGHNLVNNGTIDQTGSGSFLVVEDSTSTITNASGAQWTADLSDNRRLAYANGAANVLNLVNDGTLTKSASANRLQLGWTAGTTNITNNGVIDVLGGLLRPDVDEQVNHNGELNIAEDASLWFATGTHVFASSASLTEAGVVSVSGGVVTFPNAEAFDDLRLSGGTINAAEGLTLKAFTQSGGRLNLGESDLNFTESFAWSAGILSGTGDTIIAEDLTLTITGDVRLAGGHNLVNNGTIDQTGSGSILVVEDSTSTITNASGAQWTADLSDNRRLAYANGAANVLNLVNDGTLTKSASANRLQLGWTAGTTNITNNGVIDVLGGLLRPDVDEQVNHNGELNIAEDASLWFATGTHVFASSASLTEAGVVSVSGGVVTFPNAEAFDDLRLSGGTINAAEGLTLKAFTQSGGRLNLGESDLNFTESFAWSAGILSGTGDTIIAEDLTLTITGDVRLAGGHNLVNNGTIDQTGSGSILVVEDSTSTITNASGAQWTADLSDNRRLAYANGAANVLNLVNDGTLTKSASANRLQLGWTAGTTNITNNGVIDVLGGLLRPDVDEQVNHNGELNIAEDASLWFATGTHVFASSASLTEAGVVSVSGGVVTFPNAEAFDDLRLSGGTINAAEGLTLKAFTQSGGRLNLGESDLNFTESFAWSAGILSGTGDTIIAEDLTLTITGDVRLAGGHNLVNNGTIDQTGSGSILVVEDSTSTITNASGAQWTADLSDNRRLAYANGAANVLNLVNDGTITKSASANRLQIGWTSGTTNITNNGVIDVLGGSARIEGSSATLSASSTVRLTTNGATKPLIRQGALSIDGTLEVVLESGYNPANGTTIRLLDFGSRNGSFSTVTPPQGRTVNETYQGDGLDVTIN